MTKCLEREYDVALSFAGEDRDYVNKTAKFLKKEGVKVFYDLYEDVKLWGKDLYQHLDRVYREKAKYTIVFISESYKKKLWTNHELRSAQARAFIENQEYILPVRFDATEIAGILPTVGYLDLKKISPNLLAKKIVNKLGDIEPENFLPENISYVRSALNILYPELSDVEIEQHVALVFEKIKLANPIERELIGCIIYNSCMHSILDNLHEDVTLFERLLGRNKEQIIIALNGLSNLGFEFKIKKRKRGSKKEGNEGFYEELSLKLVNRSIEPILDNLTGILTVMFLGIARDVCENCLQKAVIRADFNKIQLPINEEDIEFYQLFK